MCRVQMDICDRQSCAVLGDELPSQTLCSVALFSSSWLEAWLGCDHAEILAIVDVCDS